MRLILLFFIFSTAAIAYQPAIVRSPKATVWAEPQQKTPVGHLKKGQFVQVGDKLKQPYLTYPLVLYNKKVAYIHVKDIYVGEELKEMVKKPFREKSSVHYLIGRRSRYSEDHFLNFNYGVFSPGDDMRRISRQLGSDDPTEFGHSFGFLYERFINPFWGWSLGGKYFLFTHQNFKYEALGLQGGFQYYFKYTKNHSLQLAFKGLAAPFAHIKTTGQYNRTLQGEMFGVQADLDYSYFYTKHWALRLSGGGQFHTLVGFNENNNNRYNYLFGAYALIGLVFRERPEDSSTHEEYNKKRMKLKPSGMTLPTRHY